MGYLDKKLQAKYLKAIRPLLRGDEQVWETHFFDIVMVHHSDGLQIPAKNAATVRTSRGVYYESKKTRAWVQIPYPEMVDLATDGQRVEIVTMVGSHVMRSSDPRNPSPARFYEAVLSSMKKLTVHKQDVPVPGGGVRVTLRPYEEGKDPTWSWQVSDGVDRKDPAVVAAVNGAVPAHLVNRYGPPLQ